LNHPGELISAYLDGELSRAEVEELSRHLAACGQCVADLEAFQAVRSAVRSLPLLELPEGIAPAAGKVIPLRRNRGFLVGAAAAMVALVIALAAILTPPTPPISINDLNSRFGARVSLDPAFGPAKVLVPDLGQGRQ
jgi:anti-sigma factor RsiW